MPWEERYARLLQTFLQSRKYLLLSRRLKQGKNNASFVISADNQRSTITLQRGNASHARLPRGFHGGWSADELFVDSRANKLPRDVLHQPDSNLHNNLSGEITSAKVIKRFPVNEHPLASERCQQSTRRVRGRIFS